MARTTTRMIRVFVVAAGILALSASAAQARPIGLVGVGVADNGQIASGVSQSYHTFYRPAASVTVMSPAVDSPNAQAAQGSVMGAAVDSPGNQSGPTVISAPTVKTTNGFDWTASLIGAAFAAMVLLLAAITASRIRPRRVAQL